VQFQLFEKNTRANYSKLNEKSYDYQLVIFMKKVTCTALLLANQNRAFFHEYYYTDVSQEQLCKSHVVVSRG